MKSATLIILGGFAGAGKTTVAKKLSAERNLPLVSTDDLNDALRHALKQDFHACSPIAHELAWALVRTYLKNGTTVLLDTNMCSERTWQNLDSLKQEMASVEVLPLILECSLETHKARIAHRGAHEPEHLNLGGDNLEDVLHKYEYIHTLHRPDLQRINADRPIDVVYEDALARIQNRPGA